MKEGIPSSGVVQVEKISTDEMKQIELEIADEIDRICRENELVYFLGYGSLIGAVRHGGFIPWDDDMDMLMLRSDYERFIDLFESVVNDERFKLVSYRDKSAPNAFVKVVDSTTWVEEKYSDAEYSSGVWVDIFPLDEAPKGGDPGLCKKCTSVANKRYLAVTDVSSGGSALIRLAKRFICPILKRVGPYTYAEKLDNLAMSHRGAGLEYLADFVAVSEPDKTYEKRYFLPVEWKFEDHSYYIPEHYDEILTIMYGDWRTPLPESEREMHTSHAYRL